MELYCPQDKVQSSQSDIYGLLWSGIAHFLMPHFFLLPLHYWIQPEWKDFSSMLFLASGTIFSHFHTLLLRSSNLSFRTQLKHWFIPIVFSMIPRLSVVPHSHLFLLIRFLLKNVFALFKMEKKEKKNPKNTTDLDFRLIVSFCITQYIVLHLDPWQAELHSCLRELLISGWREDRYIEIIIESWRRCTIRPMHIV